MHPVIDNQDIAIANAGRSGPLPRYKDAPGPKFQPSAREHPCDAAVVR
jgi:hypothetical protein